MFEKRERERRNVVKCDNNQEWINSRNALTGVR